MTSFLVPGSLAALKVGTTAVAIRATPSAPGTVQLRLHKQLALEMLLCTLAYKITDIDKRHQDIVSVGMSQEKEVHIALTLTDQTT